MHYTPLVKRKEFQLKQLSDLSLLNYMFVEKYDRENLETKDLDKFKDDALPLGSISLFIKHIYAMELIHKSNYKFNLVLEDDAVLQENFVKKLENGLKQLPVDYDMLFIGDGCNLHIQSSEIKPDKLIYKKCREATEWGGLGATRCTDSYLVSKKCSKKLINYISNIKKEVLSNQLIFG